MTDIGTTTTEKAPKIEEPKKIYWFNKLPMWLKVILVIFFWWVFIPVLLWPKIKNKNLRIGLMTVWSIIFILPVLLINLAIVGAIISPSKVETPDAKVEIPQVQEITATESNNSETSTNQAPVEEVISEPTPPPIPDTIEQKVSKSIPKDCKDCTSIYSDRYAILTINTDKQSWFNSTSEFESLLKNFVYYARLFKDMPEVTTITVQHRATLVDQKGNTQEGTVMSIKMNKEVFQEYNFNNIEYDRVYNSLNTEASITILPSTKEKINFDKVKVFL